MTKSLNKEERWLQEPFNISIFLLFIQEYYFDIHKKEYLKYIFERNFAKIDIIKPF